jgi:hypothetical protein
VTTRERLCCRRVSHGNLWQVVAMLDQLQESMSIVFVEIYLGFHPVRTEDFRRF